MSRRAWIVVGVILVLLVAGGLGVRAYLTRRGLPAIAVETIRTRSLDAIV